MDRDRLNYQVLFITEIDHLKSVYRRTYLINEPRLENSAEHSWHLAIMAFLLAEYSKEPIDLLKVMKMALVHDLVEIDAGDTYIYDEQGNKEKTSREGRAANRIFNLLPSDQAQEIRDLWEEFEAGHTPEAKFVVAMDRLQPLLNNYYTEGISWKEHHIKSNQVIERVKSILTGSQMLWELANKVIEDAVNKGYLEK